MPGPDRTDSCISKDWEGIAECLRAELADEETAADLGYEVGAAILVMQMLYRTTDGQPVELTIAKHRADRFSITYELANTGG